LLNPDPGELFVPLPINRSKTPLLFTSAKLNTGSNAFEIDNRLFGAMEENSNEHGDPHEINPIFALTVEVEPFKTWAIIS
jgi:hypothetical protein